MYQNHMQQPPKPKRSKKKVLGISLGVLAGIIVIGGLAGGSDPAPTQATPKPSPSVSQTESAEEEMKRLFDENNKALEKQEQEDLAEAAEDALGTDAEETAFLMALELSGMDTFENESDETLIKWGNKACELKEQGQSDNAASLALERETGGNMFAMAFLVGAAQGAMCSDTM